MITKMTLSYSKKKVRKEPKEGDLKILKDGRKYIRKASRIDGMYHVRNGRQLYDWHLLEWEYRGAYGIWYLGPFEIREGEGNWTVYSDGRRAYRSSAIGDEWLIFESLEEAKAAVDDWFRRYQK